MATRIVGVCSRVYMYAYMYVHIHAYVHLHKGIAMNMCAHARGNQKPILSLFL